MGGNIIQGASFRDTISHAGGRGMHLAWSRDTQFIHPYSLAKMVRIGCHHLSHRRNFQRPINVIDHAMSRKIQMELVTCAQPAGRAEQCFFIASLLLRS